MWNLLRLPLAALGIAADVARAMAELPRLLEALEARLERLARAADRGDAILAELQRLGGVVEGLTEQVAVLLAEVQTLRDQTADSAPLQDQLERTQAELAAANRAIGRMIETDRPAEMPGPAETAAGRRGRFTSAFRRSSPAKPV